MTAHLQHLALHGPASDSEELEDEVARIRGPNLAPRDHLPAMDSHSNTSELNNAGAHEPDQHSSMASEHNRAASTGSGVSSQACRNLLPTYPPTKSLSPTRVSDNDV